MMPSDGLTTIEGSGSAGRRPGLSSRVKQSCRLLNSVFLASDRSRSENIRQQAIESVADQRVLDLAEPAHEARQRRPRDAVGQQEVEVLLLGQGGDQAPDCHDSVRWTG